MKAIRVTRLQRKALQDLSRKDINTIRKHPGILPAARDLLPTCGKVIKRVAAILDRTGRRKRRTAHRKILALREQSMPRTAPPVR